MLYMLLMARMMGPVDGGCGCRDGDDEEERRRIKKKENAKML